MIPTIHGRIFVHTSCLCSRIKFRLYVGHIGFHSIHVAIRHLTEKEVRYGLSYLTKQRYFIASLSESSGYYKTTVLINKSSLFKRFEKAGCFKQDVLAYFLGSSLDQLGLVYVKNHTARWISPHAFDSHGPLG